MAISYLATAEFVQPTGSGSDTISLPGTPAEDDIVVVVRASDRSLTNGTFVTSGYTSVYSNGSTNTPAARADYKRMGATPDTDVEINRPNDSRETCGIIQTFSGVDTTTAIDATAANDNGGTGLPDPPSYTTVTDDALRIIAGYLDDEAGDGNFSAPAGYSNLADKDTDVTGTTAASVMIASKAAGTAGAENPAAFTTSGSENDSWFAIHFALRPAAGGGGQTISVGLTTETDEALSINISIDISVSQALEQDIILAPAVRGFNPKDITGCIRWYDATDPNTLTGTAANVEQWDDKSDSADHATQVGATVRPSEGSINGLTAIEFDGIDEFFNIPHPDGLTGSQNFTVFIVMELDDTPSSTEYPLSWGDNATNAGVVCKIDTGRGYNWETFNNNESTDQEISAGRAYVLTARLNGTAQDDVTQYLNRSALTLSDTATINIVSTTEGAIGRLLAFDSNYFDGKIGEIIIYDNAISDANRDLVWDYLEAKWGIELGTSVGLAEEADSTLGITQVIDEIVSVGLVSENDNTLDITLVVDEIVSIGLAEETDTAFAVSTDSIQPGDIGPSYWFDWIRLKRRNVG